MISVSEKFTVTSPGGCFTAISCPPLEQAASSTISRNLPTRCYLSLGISLYSSSSWSPLKIEPHYLDINTIIRKNVNTNQNNKTNTTNLTIPTVIMSPCSCCTHAASECSTCTCCKDKH
ncbi:hypothetical protein OCU04_000349 [Sclerotinia nivalis]|uniref:Uncharacterized protein n=1 Tax=Sclerotinia nivalis TaxID=352851 RepID=A0A9X0AVW5_9HELO|nr:hypothetical protein OCU04_000349 [Sclerotinia nivalis]